MWAAAGLTDADIPTTWDQLTAVAKKLTKTDASGKMTQEGFGLNGYAGYSVDMLSYQLGSYMYKSGGRAVNVDDAHKQALQRVIDWYDKDKVSSRDFPNNNDSFAQGKTAMIYMWGWFAGYLQANNKDLEFGVFKLPTWDGKTPKAYDRNNGESTFSVNPKAPPANMAVAFDFVKYCIDNEDHNAQLALKGSCPLRCQSWTARCGPVPSRPTGIRLRPRRSTMASRPACPPMRSCPCTNNRTMRT
jgi:multiple sugar transport system substrate-binding protein